jgi:hypothetical protein
MEKKFNELPMDMRTSILGYNPYSQQLNTAYKQSTQYLFYNEYCDTPISQKEFINYVNIFKPEQFAIFVNADEKFKFILFTYDDVTNKYAADFYLLTIELVDVEEYKIIYEYTEYHMDSFNHLINTFKNNYQYDVFYDLQLSINILKERSCNQINPTYSYNFVKNQFVKHTTINTTGQDVNETFKLTTSLWYMIASYAIWNRSEIDIESVYYYLDDIIFDSMGEALDDISQTINQLNKQYDTYFDLIANHILTPLK